MIKWILVISCLLTTASCSIKYSFSGASISPDIKTFSVAEFDNISTRIVPTLSNTFTEALKDKFLSEARLSLVRTNGDLNFEGRITRYDLSYQAVVAGDYAAMNRLTISVEITFKNAKEPLKDFVSTFSRYTDFSSDINFDSVEDEKIRIVIEQLVDDIFMKAAADW